MRDKSYEISLLQDTLNILKQGYYTKNGKKIELKLKRQEM